MPCAVSAFLILAAPAAAEDGGGASAPAGAPAAGPVPYAAPAATPGSPAAEGAQDETPTTPEGEEQPPDEQDGNTPTDDGGGGSGGVDELPLDGAAPGSESAEEALPRSGFESFALASIGLGLLLAGAALRPTSSWPRPRDRLSRSTLRR
jgi:hypothetical protein